MVLVIKHVKRITKQPIDRNSTLTGSDTLSQKVQMNFIVTASHIVLILTYTIVMFLADNFVSLQQNAVDRLNTSVFFFSGLLDLFMAYMMWFMTDGEQEVPIIVRDEERKLSYSVIEVVKGMQIQH